MKNKTIKLWMRVCAVLGLALLAGNATAQTTVTTLGGGQPYYYYGYRDGTTLTSALFHTPSGLALDSTGQYLFVADRDNNVIRYLDLVGKQTYTLGLTYSNLISKPVAVAVDSYDYVYVLNRGNGANGSVYTFDVNLFSPTYGEALTNAVGLTNATGMALDSNGNIYVTIQSNKLIRIDAYTANKTTIATVAMAGTSLQGIAVKHNGMIAACDSGRNGIYLINPTNGIVTTNAGFHGVGDFTSANNIAASSQAMFNQPMCVAETGDGTLVVTDYGNNRVKAVLTSGVVTNLYGVSSQNWGAWVYPGWYDGTVKIPDSNYTPPIYNVQSRQPFGVVMAPDGSFYTSEDNYHIIRKVTGAGLLPPLLPPPPPPAAPTILTITANYVTANNGQVTLTWTPVSTATNYNVKRSQSSGAEVTISTTAGTSYSDTTVINGNTYYYVVSALNTGGEGSNSTEVSITVPNPPVPDPQIGYVDFPVTSTPVQYTSVFHPVSSSGLTFNNDQLIVVVGATGSQTFYNLGTTVVTNTPTNGIPNPTSASSSAPSGYADGNSYNGVLNNYAIAGTSPHPILPDMTIRAIGEQSGHPNSSIVQARFQFVTANPLIAGNNAAQFSISDITAGAHLYYTIDGSTPSATNGVDLGTVATPTNNWAVGFSITTNTLFQVVAVRPNYQPSAVVSTIFSVSNYVANIISFGFGGTQEASSAFIASPGQVFYAPVTLSPLPGAKMYSLQFNLTVTNAGLNPGPSIAGGAVEFKSMLLNLINNIYYPIPPYMFIGSGTNPPPTSVPNPIMWNGNWFQNLVFTNTSENLLGVGWLEEILSTNLYDTVSQDLIKYSSALNDVFDQSAGKVVLGGFAFQVPDAATNGQTYQIQIGRASATSDGIGAPGSSVIISAPTNNVSVNNFPVSALETVTIGQLKYIAGSVYPFRWFNAGDFGSTNIVNADVEQVFGFAIYGGGGGFPSDSDLFDAMDSCGGTYVDLGHGYLEFNSYISGPSALNPLFDGDDTSINQIAFGDGVLDVCDVYVTFRRSLDPSLTWFERYWNNGQRVADTGAPNVASKLAKAATSSSVQSKAQSSSTVPPQVNFAAGDIQGSAGQVVQIPVTATIFGSYPLRVLMLNLTVEPLDGSPALTTQVQFTQIAPLGAPYITSSKGSGNYSAVWLNSTNAGLTGTATIGTLTVTIPAGAPANAAYAVHFDHASASPNGIASFPKQTLTGLITLSSRTNSSYSDGIPDSWRLRWFGTVNNLLSISNACPSGDGINNWKKYVAGVDPTIANDFPSLYPKTPVPSGSTTAIHWPSVSGKQYVILRSSSLFPGSWTAIATNTGTGTDMEFDDSTKGSVHFYRVQILP